MMKKSRKQRRYKPPNRARARQHTGTTPPSRFVRIAKWLVSTTLALVALAGFSFYFRPHVAVSQNQPLNPKDPFSVPFIVKNEGQFSLYDVASSCYFHSSHFKKAGNVASITTLTVPASQSSTRSEMLSGDAQTTSCLNPMPSDELESADVSIMIDYHAAYTLGLFRCTRDVRFVTIRDSDGNLRWTPASNKLVNQHG